MSVEKEYFDKDRNGKIDLLLEKLKKIKDRSEFIRFDLNGGREVCKKIIDDIFDSHIKECEYLAMKQFLEKNTEKLDNYKHIKTEENYNKLLKSGMFWEFYPELSGEWEKDKLIFLQ